MKSERRIFNIKPDVVGMLIELYTLQLKKDGKAFYSGIVNRAIRLLYIAEMRERNEESSKEKKEGNI